MHLCVHGIMEGLKRGFIRANAARSLRAQGRRYVYLCMALEGLKRGLIRANAAGSL